MTEKTTNQTELNTRLADTRYNGWTNYETWHTALVLDNDQSTQEYWREQAKEAYEEAVKDHFFSKVENACFTLQDQLKAEITNGINDRLGELENTDVDMMIAAFVQSGLSETNWYEIAKHLVEGVTQDE